MLNTKNIVILISGRGSNLESLIKPCKSGIIPANVLAVISNNSSAQGLSVAEKLGVPTKIVDRKAYQDRAAFEQALILQIDLYNPDLILLAGFMSVLSAKFIEYYSNKTSKNCFNILNIHPSLLPNFPGLNTHKRALAAKVKIHGATVHFVTSKLDAGPIIIQATVPVYENDTEETLAARVLAKEREIYPKALTLFITGNLKNRLSLR